MRLVDDEVLNLFIKIQDQINPDISIEVGAFAAEFSLEMLKFDIDIYAFEASPYVYDKYKDKLDKINYINKAVSNKNEVIKFEIVEGGDPSYSTSNSIKNRNEARSYYYIDVDSISINQYFINNNFKKGALWVDAEGASEEVLTGANNKLKDFASIYIELEGQEYWKECWQKNDVIQYLNKNDFILVFEKPCYDNQFDSIFINKKYMNDIII
jgi:FkbM family methyltransferase